MSHKKVRFDNNVKIINIEKNEIVSEEDTEEQKFERFIHFLSIKYNKRLSKISGLNIEGLDLIDKTIEHYNKKRKYMNY